MQRRKPIVSASVERAELEFILRRVKRDNRKGIPTTRSHYVSLAVREWIARQKRRTRKAA